MTMPTQAAAAMSGTTSRAAFTAARAAGVRRVRACRN
jgi:hypothetical protein